MPKITVMPSNKSFSAEVGENLYHALTQQGIEINAVCGGKGTCGKCKVTVVPANSDGKEPRKSFQLACKTEVTGDIVVNIPTVRDAAIRKAPLYKKFSLPVQTDIIKTHLNLPKPSINDQRSDWERLDAYIPVSIKNHPSLTVLESLPEVLRDSDFKITAVIKDSDVIAVEKGDTTSNMYGLAFDVGTTSIVAYLLNLNTGDIVAVRSTGNPQRAAGADVISRIEYANNNDEGSAFLRDKVVSAINELINQLIDAAGVERKYIYLANVVGNTTMHHLLLGLTPRNLAIAPFIPVTNEGLNLPAEKLGIKISEYGRIFILPNMAGFVGSDTVAAILATGIYRKPEKRLVIDIGTNGEIALGSREGIMVCSTAAGPAFEGAQIRFGMRAADGAIEGIKIREGKLECRVIGETSPIVGICGSGLIQGVAEMLANGIVNSTGRMIDPDEAQERLSPDLAQRVQRFEEQNAFLLVQKDSDTGQKPVYITQKDVRELQLAKAAIAAGIKIMMNEMDIGLEDIEEILLAGAFGSYIDTDSALTLGLIPQVPLQKIKSVGNAAGTGAMLTLLSQNMKSDAEKIAAVAANIELSSRPDFQQAFVNEMIFIDPA